MFASGAEKRERDELLYSFRAAQDSDNPLERCKGKRGSERIPDTQFPDGTKPTLDEGPDPGPGAWESLQRGDNPL